MTQQSDAYKEGALIAKDLIQDKLISDELVQILIEAKKFRKSNRNLSFTYEWFYNIDSAEFSDLISNYNIEANESGDVDDFFRGLFERVIGM